MKNFLIAIAAITLFLVGGRWWSKNLQKNNVEKITASGELVSETGIHWHPELAIYIKGQKQAIPANLGIGMQYAGYPLYDPMMMMTSMHTHDDSGTLHWEAMEWPVKKEDVRLANFFAIWAKKFDENCIFENCNGADGTVKMLVNGNENTEFQNYLVEDKDRIEIRYE